jgi:FAD synthetase
MKVLTFGTFDILHIGHLNYLKQAREIAGVGELHVIVARDINAEKIKAKKLIHDENERLEIISQLKIIDKAILGEKENIFDSVKKINPDIVVLGYDQLPSNEILKEKFKDHEINAKIVRAKPFKDSTSKSSKIRNSLFLVE